MIGFEQELRLLPGGLLMELFYLQENSGWEGVQIFEAHKMQALSKRWQQFG